VSEDWTSTTRAPKITICKLNTICKWCSCPLSDGVRSDLSRRLFPAMMPRRINARIASPWKSGPLSCRLVIFVLNRLSDLTDGTTNSLCSGARQPPSFDDRQLAGVRMSGAGARRTHAGSSEIHQHACLQSSVTGRIEGQGAFCTPHRRRRTAPASPEPSLH